MAKFIVFEGPDGAGKSTQIIEASRYLKEKGIKHVVFQDPGCTGLGDTVRKIVKSGELVSRTAEILLFIAARAELVESLIRPALERGYHVLCDRFELSTWAYQVNTGRSSVGIHSYVGNDGLNPNAYLVFLADHQELRRRRKERTGTDVFEEDDSLSTRVENGYRDIIHKGVYRGTTVHPIIGGDVSEVQERVKTLLDEILNG